MKVTAKILLSVLIQILLMTIILLVIVLTAGCVRERPHLEASVESSRLLFAPTICDGYVSGTCNAYGGYTCFDTRGGVVFCPGDGKQPCKVLRRVHVEAPLLPVRDVDAGVAEAP